MISQTDRIEKTVVLRAPRARVWAAIVDAKRFGTWFGVRFERDFAVGAHLVGTVVPNAVDAAMAEAMAPHVGVTFDPYVDRIEPMDVFAYRWHPFYIERDVDYSAEAMTTVLFELADAHDGTSLRITETGFDGLPLARRTRAFEAHEEGWPAMTGLLQTYLSRATD